MHRSQIVPKQPLNNSGRKPGETLDSDTAANANNNGANSNASNKPLTRHIVECVVTKPDVFPEFLQSLKTLTKSDFEHASVADRKLDITNIGNIPPERPLTIKGCQTEGFSFFAQNSPSVAGNLTRPLTAEPGGSPFNNAEEDLQGKNILRPVSAYSPSNRGGGGGGKPRALTKSKVSPSQESLTSEEEVDVDEVDRPPTATNSDLEDDYDYNSASESERPSSSGSAKRVTFASDVVNYERENKPSKRRKMPKRRKQGFPHPSRGLFIPPEKEIIESSGPTGICRDNAYLNFNQVWAHPSSRTTEDSNSSQLIRQERFHRLMSDLEHAHIHYNRLKNMKQNDYLTQSIFKRYILVLDLALTEGHLNQVEHLLETISKSISVLHQNTFVYMYGSKVSPADGSDKEEKPLEMQNENHNLLLASYSLSRISGKLCRIDSAKMCIETVLVKLCLELIEVVFSTFGSFVYRNALNTLPYTVRQAMTLLKEIKSNKIVSAYVKWINNSAVQRDFRSILKNLGLMDKYGAKQEIPNSISPVVAGSRGNKKVAGENSPGRKQNKAV